MPSSRRTKKVRSRINIVGGKKSKKSKKSTKSKASKPIESIKSMDFMSTSTKLAKAAISRGDAPKYSIKYAPSFSRVTVALKEGQEVIGDWGSMSYMDADVKVKTSIKGGIWKGLKRALLTSDSLFLTSYIGTGPKEQNITFASYLPGDINTIAIQPNEQYVISQQGMLAVTGNVIVDTQTRFRGMFVGQGAFMSKLYTKDNNVGLAWIASYGAIEKHTLAKGERLKVDNGLFLMCKKEVNYSIGKVGGIKSAILSGEGLVMNFTGPAVVYTQTRNLSSFLGFITNHIKRHIKNRKNKFGGTRKIRRKRK